MKSLDHFLGQAHLRTRHVQLVWSLGLAALGFAGTLAAKLEWWSNASLAALGPGMAALILLLTWLFCSRRLATTTLAQRLDAQWNLAGRLETAAELASDRSALAQAQRADSSQHLGSRPIPSSTRWFTGIGLLTIATLVILIELVALVLRREPIAPKIASVPPSPSTLVWKTPAPAIKATAIEEIPLTAQATTGTGFRALSLEVSVNGEARLSRPLEPAALAALASPGQHPLSLALYLDEVGAQEFDLVTYHLRAESVPAQPAAVVVSALQFVQIRPPREDAIRQKGGMGAKSEELATLLGDLKAAQLELLQQNFLLAHAPLDHALPVWREENTRVAADQKTLADKTAEARTYAITAALPVLVVDNLGQCVPLMTSAATQISAASNEPAAKAQGQALGLIIATEKVLHKFINEGESAPSEPKAANRDPFKDEQLYQLPPRAATSAGQLEQLAQAQSEVDKKLSDPTSPPKALAAEQANLAEKLAALAGEKKLEPAVQAKLEQAARDAADAARQLEQNDPVAARAPATAAAQGLREATAIQEATGRAAALAALEPIRRELNAAGRLADSAQRKAALTAATAKLAAEAQQQQQTGSAEAARQLATAAEKAHKAAQKPDATGASEAAATAATQTQAALAQRPQVLARAARQLAGGRTGDGAKVLVEMELGAQLAAQLLTDPAGRALATQLATELGHGAGAGGGTGEGEPEALRGKADQVIALLEAARALGQRDEQVRRFNPEDLDPVYRESIDAYFEKLSRGAARR